MQRSERAGSAIMPHLVFDAMFSIYIWWLERLARF